MSASLIVLSMAAFAMVAALVSFVAGAALPWLDRLAARLAPRQRLGLWLTVAAMPAAFGILAVLVSFLPAFGLGHDHCLAHGLHHPHLCPAHAGGAPGLVLIAIAVWTVCRAAAALVQLGMATRVSRATARSLADASDERDGVHVFPSDEPQAFVLGVLRPRVHVSSGLLALGPEVAEPVLAHERAHADRRDPLWRLLCPVLSVVHLPTVGSAIGSRLSTAQEITADAEAAESLPGDGRLRMAETLMTLARRPRTPLPGLSFADGDVEARIRALLEDRQPRSVWPARLLLATGAAVPLVVGVAHDFVHHGLETLLGALS